VVPGLGFTMQRLQQGKELLPIGRVASIVVQFVEQAFHLIDGGGNIMVVVVKFL
jgi:hypothetical protein